MCIHVCVQSLSRVQLFVTPRTVAHQASLSIDFPGKNTRVGCPFLLQGIFLIETVSPASPALAGRFFTTRATWEAKEDTVPIYTIEYCSGTKR